MNNPNQTKEQIADIIMASFPAKLTAQPGMRQRIINELEVAPDGSYNFKSKHSAGGFTGMPFEITLITSLLQGV